MADLTPIKAMITDATWSGRHAKHFDASSLRCPMPVLYAKEILDGMDKNDLLVIRVTDPSFKIDFLVMCDKYDYKFIDSGTDANNLHVHVIEK
jgi:tRNA 2-thiouridine synthesizing protein A